MAFVTHEARVASFAPPTKRSKGWPHQSPSPEDLANAGFFWKPTSSKDNVECFMCGRYLDGWEADDDALQEHFKHGPDCPWALLMTLEAESQHDTATMHDPTSSDIADARRSTFETLGWPHEGKRGWTCKTDKMVEAGWHFAPTAECDDYTSCVYCKLSLDGWEPKDNPFDEHYRRSPDCPFFVFAGTTQPSKRPKKKAGRPSRASKASSRLSTQSNATAASASHADESTGIIEILGEDTTLEDPVQDHSMVSIQSTTSTAATKGKRKAPARAKNAPAKKCQTTRGKKKASGLQTGPQTQVDEAQAEEEAVASQPKKPRGRKKQPPQADEEIADAEQEQPPSKKTRSQKVQPAPQPEPEPAPGLEMEVAAEHEAAHVVEEPPKWKASKGKPRDKWPSLEAEEEQEAVPVKELTPEPAPEFDPDGPEVESEPAQEEPPSYPPLPVETPDEEFQDAPEMPAGQNTPEQDQQETGPPPKECTPVPVKQRSPLKEQSNPPRPTISPAQNEEQQKHRSPRRSSRKHGAPAPQKPKEESPSTSPRSDVENQPPSSLPAQSRPPISTPGRAPPHWTPIAVDTVFRDPNEQPLNLFGGAVTGTLSEQEKEMTVQHWIEHIAAEAEANLSAEGERIVTIFEREGQRALAALESIQCV